MSLFDIIGSDNLQSENQAIITKLSELNRTIIATISAKQNGNHNLDLEIDDYFAAMTNAKEIFESML